ncbi:MAG TPA: hypothetical protein VLE72_02270 [Candidatus Saccharimonadales bacterium]|nr:hypothetical protein [Candidatus Saccharimonadales bacterium]
MILWHYHFDWDSLLVVLCMVIVVMILLGFHLRNKTDLLATFLVAVLMFVVLGGAMLTMAGHVYYQDQAKKEDKRARAELIDQHFEVIWVDTLNHKAKVGVPNYRPVNGYPTCQIEAGLREIKKTWRVMFPLDQMNGPLAPQQLRFICDQRIK